MDILRQTLCTTSRAPYITRNLACNERLEVASFQRFFDFPNIHRAKFVLKIRSRDRGGKHASKRASKHRPTLFSWMASVTRGTSASTSSLFLPRVLFRRYSEDRNASVQLRLPVTRRIGPRLTMPRLLAASPSSRSSSSSSGGRRRCRRGRHPFSPILFHARFSLSSPTLFPTTRRYTTRVFNLVHLIVGFVGAFVALRART